MPVFLVWMPQKCNLPNVNAKNANLPNVGEEFVKCFSIPAVRPAVLRGRVVVDYGSRSVRAPAQPPNPICTPSHTPQFPIPSKPGPSPHILDIYSTNPDILLLFAHIIIAINFIPSCSSGGPHQTMLIPKKKDPSPRTVEDLVGLGV